MFVITKEKSVRARDIIGVFDLDTATISSVTKNFLSSAEKSGEIEGTNNLPKSFILVNSISINRINNKINKEKKNRIYLSSRLANYINR
jgi:hypothetical protein